MHRRTLLKTLGSAVPVLAALSPASLLAAPAIDPRLGPVHPELRQIARGILGMTAQMPAFSARTLPAIRQGAERFSAPPLADVPFEERRVPGLAGQGEVPVFVVNGGRPGARPAILHIHGGGYVSGSARSQVNALQQLCRTLDCVAVTVGYRLAPETTFAGSVEDTYAGLKWLHANGAALGVDPARIAVMGESAGGGHAALLAIAARDRGEVPVAFQCLVYPMLDDRTGSTRQPPPHVGNLLWTRESNRFGWEAFLGTRPGGRTAPKGAVPARVADLSGLPPAWIGVGSIDLFHDEDVDFAQRLNAAGVPTELLVVPGAFHGFDAMPGLNRVVSQFNEAKIAALRAGLGIAAA